VKNNTPVGYYSVKKIKPADFNPSSRIRDTALRMLERDIASDGKILNPLHIFRPDFKELADLIDGHRRYSVAVKLGIDLVPVVIHTTGDRVQLWQRLNRFTRPISALDWMEVWLRVQGTKEVIDVPASQRRHIKNCLDIFGGLSGIRYLVDKRTAPAVANSIIPIYNAFRDLSESMHITKVQVGHWVVENELAHNLKVLYDLKPSWKGVRGLRKLAEKARDNQKFTLNEFLK